MGAYDILLKKEVLSDNNEKTESAIEMAVSHLEAENASKALGSFERLLETNTKVPAAWIGRAYALALNAKKGEGEFKDELISKYIGKGIDLISDKEQKIKDDASAIGMSLYLDNYSNAINQVVENAVKSREESEKASAAAANAMLGAVVGGVVGASSNSSLFKTIGYAAAGGGAATAISQTGQAKKLASIGEGVFSSAIRLAYLSVPVVMSVHGATQKCSEYLLSKLNGSLLTWKTSITHLFYEQTNRIESMADQVITKLKNPHKALKYLEESDGGVQEIKNLVILADEVGLDNHTCFELLTQINDDIESLGDKEAIRKDIEGADKKGTRGLIFGFSCLALFFVLVAISENLLYIGLVVNFVGLYFFSWGYYKSDSQKKLIGIFEKLKTNKTVFASVKPDSFEFDALGKQ